MDADMQLDSTILKLAEQRAAIDARRKGLNEDAREINANVDKLGINPSAFMLAVRLVKGMDKRDRDDFLSSTRRVTRVIGERQFELYPEESERLRKKAEDKKAREAEAKTAAGRDPDHPRSNPKSGGAGKKKAEGKKKPATAKEAAGAAAAEGQAIIDAGISARAGAEAIVQQSDPDEQRDGAKTIADLMPQTTAAQGQPLSQSELARQKLEEAMSPGKAN